MNHIVEKEMEMADPAAIFAAALSLWEACINRAASNQRLNLSECYQGMDQFMREVMRIANDFENWACRHVAFSELTEVWPYLLEDKFGDACLKQLSPAKLYDFEENDCLFVAINMGLPILLSNDFPLPVDLRVYNPVHGSAFIQLRIQTVRDALEDPREQTFSANDDPFYKQFSPPYFVLYGIDINGVQERIAVRRTCSEIFCLARKLMPNAVFLKSPIYTQSTRLD